MTQLQSGGLAPLRCTEVSHQEDGNKLFLREKKRSAPECDVWFNKGWYNLMEASQESRVVVGFVHV